MSDESQTADQRVKVLYVFAALPVGGAEEVLITEVEGLDKTRFDPLVCVLSEKGPVGERIENRGFPVVALQRMKSHRFDPWIIRDLYRLIKDQRADVVHTHLYDGNKYGRLAAGLARVPALISHYHNVYPRRRTKYHLINWILSFLNDRIVAVSQAVKESVVAYDRIPPRKIQVIYNGIDLSSFKGDFKDSDLRQKFGVKPEDFLIGVVARLEEQKGHIYLFRALRRLMPDFPQIKVLVVGDGTLRPVLEAQVMEMGLSEQVLFAGTRKDILEILATLDLFILPSLWEGFSIALLEAMAMGRPVIATSVGGASEAIRSGHDGLLVPPGEESSLVTAVREALLDPRRYEEMGRRGKETVGRQFTVAQHLTRLQDLYLEVLARKGLPAVRSRS
jgi:glycosyltransferase involved in cell wall biosynthesis